ncbi:MAG: hypothetical protein JWO98_1231 [Frankiales bacterium]|nr:hypothetical protein [Frankiales bacterium]
MSAAAYHVIRCDGRIGEGCGADAEIGTSFEARNVTQVRAHAKKVSGWRRTRDGRDLCPECGAAATNPAKGDQMT